MPAASPHAERDAVELEERAEREKKLQDEVFRLGEVASRQAEALEAKNAELLPLREFFGIREMK